MKNKKFLIAVLFASFAAGAKAQHENCDHGDAPDASLHTGLSNFVQVDKMSLEAVNLTTAKAESKAIENIIMAVGKIENIPSQISAVSSRVAGRIAELYVSPDMRVKKGQPICRIESLLPGNPPPSVVLKSPIGGIVETLNAVNGSPVEPNTEIARITDISKLYAVANVFESYVGKLRIGLAARIKLEAFGEKTFSARLVKFGSKISEGGNTLPVYFELDNPSLSIKSGMRAIFYISEGSGDAAVAVPKGAIIGDSAKKFVFVEKCPEDKIYEKRQVILGRSDDVNSEILHGLKAGETVAASGAYQLQFMPPADIDAHSHADDLPGENSAGATKAAGNSADYAQTAPKEPPSAKASESSAGVSDSGNAGAQTGNLWDRLEHSGYFYYLLYAILAASLLLNAVFAAAFSRNKRKN